jgi:Concanavalin A-like lectin/glucanases superfamily
MPELWELICRHTYRGTPGVVVDLSPSGASHGRAYGLIDGDFLKDGAAAGSGAVRCIKLDGRIAVPTQAAPWQSIEGLRAEVTLRRQPAISAFMIDGGSFHFYIRSDALAAWFVGGSPVQYAEIVSTFDPVGPQPYQVPVQQWVTLGFMYDGFDTMELSADGQVVARRNGAYASLLPLAPALSIGNSVSGGSFINGEIDEVKIWRLNPLRFDQEFSTRPRDGDTADCWRRFWQQIIQASRRHPDCAREIAAAIKAATDGVRREARAKGPETRNRLAATAREYQRLWRAGQLDSVEMTNVLVDLIDWLRLVGIDLATDPRLSTLSGSSCLKTILAEISPLDCDSQFTAMLRSICMHLDGPRPGRVKTGGAPKGEQDSAPE